MPLASRTTATPSTTTRSAPSLRAAIFALSMVLLLTSLYQLPTVMDFQKFAFYDEGAWIHLNQLVAAGQTPTIDLSYSYGTLPLLLSRAWFAAFGYSPWTYFAFLILCNLFSAAGIATALHAAGLSWQRLFAACLLLPLAITPNNYSLMHPLEMLLIIWALACAARNHFGIALAFASAALFTKPSMAYVLGFFLLLLGILFQFHPASSPSPAPPLRQRLRKFLPHLLPPSLTVLALLLISIAALGLKPALANIFPIAGAAAYKQMNFGIFHAGLDFWLYGFGIAGTATHTLPDILHHYFLTPTLYWILASLLLWTLGIRAASRLWRARSDSNTSARPSDPLILLLALLHAAFVFEFYAWAGSWTYYSYLLVLGLLIGLRGRRQTLLLRCILLVALLGLTERYSDAWGRWFGPDPSPDSGNLFVYADVLDEARQVRELAKKYHGYYLVNGALPSLWPEAQTPPVWFLSPGIPTSSEIARIRRQWDAAGVVILYKPYDQLQEAFFWPEFAAQRKAFELRTWKVFIWTVQEKPLLETRHFLVLQRHAESGSPPARPIGP